jgi:hypothetical protein
MTSKIWVWGALVAGAGVAHGETVTKTFPAADLSELDLSNGSGRIVVDGADVAEATVIADKIDFGDDCDLSIGKVGTRLVVDTHSTARFFGRAKCQVDFRVTVPRATALDLKSGSGGIKITGSKGVVAFKSGSGQVDVDGEILSLDGKSGSGGVRINGLTGDGEVKTGSGDITVTYKRRPPRGRLELKSGSGDATVYLPAGSHVRTSFMAGSGALTNELGDTPDAPFSIAAKAGSGNLAVKPL